MPEADPKASRTYIWTISCILFICIASGGGCLLAYIATPDSSALLPALGFTLVCMPWIFWITTILYRITSRTFGFRMVIGNLYSTGSVARGGSDRGGDGGGGAAAAMVNDDDITHDAQIVDVRTAKSPPSSPGNGGIRHVQFGDEDQKKGDHQKKEQQNDINNHVKRPGSSSSNSSNDISVTSHESEMPLALSMAS